ncbi:hypothetical protein MTR_8g092880 [Medicago truncatula]|uniref:Uncharacterized protein n=1 Tax=Medicago truncatula TaxID=3880 RepID=A0A072TTS5_MEDTR|nr:hypothetical protein MTR_8g092880 [Medicago truncatula]
MENSFDSLSEVMPGRESWRFKGATTRKQLLYVFQKNWDLNMESNLNTVLYTNGTTVLKDKKVEHFLKAFKLKSFYFSVILSTYEFIATYEKWRIIYAIREGRLLINPDIPEALQLKNGCYCISIVVTRVLYFWVGFDGVETSKTVPILAPRVSSSFDEVF